MLDTLYRFAIVIVRDGGETLLSTMYDVEAEPSATVEKWNAEKKFGATYRVVRIQVTELPDEMPEYNDHTPLI